MPESGTDAPEARLGGRVPAPGDGSGTASRVTAAVAGPPASGETVVEGAVAVAVSYPRLRSELERLRDAPGACREAP